MKVTNDNIASPELSVKIVAEIVDINCVHLHHKLKELINQPTYDLMHNFRLKRAANPLASKYQSIDGVAALTGFANAAYFSTTLKELHGTTSTAYMKQDAAPASSNTK